MVTGPSQGARLAPTSTADPSARSPEPTTPALFSLGPGFRSDPLIGNHVGGKPRHQAVICQQDIPRGNLMAGLQTGSFPLGILSGVCKPTTTNRPSETEAFGG